jgi:hypothetical protein
MTVSADDANEFAEVLEAAHQWLLAGMVANDPPPVAMIIEDLRPIGRLDRQHAIGAAPAYRGNVSRSRRAGAAQ